MDGRRPRIVVWNASSRRDLKELPKTVRRIFGVALYAIQCGVTPPAAKPLKGFGGAGVLELIADERGNAYRAVYTVRLASAVFVLHVFQKKSMKEIATPQSEIEMIRRRLNRAEEIDRARMET